MVSPDGSTTLHGHDHVARELPSRLVICSMISAICTRTLSNFDFCASVRNGFGNMLWAFLAIPASSSRRRVRCLLVMVTLHLESHGSSRISPSMSCSCDSSVLDSDANAWICVAHSTGISGLDPSGDSMMGAWTELRIQRDGQHTRSCALVARHTAACKSEMLRHGRLRVCQDSSGRNLMVQSCMRAVVKLRALPCADDATVAVSLFGFPSNILADLRRSGIG